MPCSNLGSLLRCHTLKRPTVWQAFILSLTQTINVECSPVVFFLGGHPRRDLAAVEAHVQALKCRWESELHNAGRQVQRRTEQRLQTALQGGAQLPGTFR